MKFVQFSNDLLIVRSLRFQYGLLIYLESEDDFFYQSQFDGRGYYTTTMEKLKLCKMRGEL